MPFYSKDGFACSCNKNECDECNKKYVVHTNADRIRAMTDEGLARWIQKTTGCPTWIDIEFECRKNYKDCDCEVCWLEWLKEESEDN